MNIIQRTFPYLILIFTVTGQNAVGEFFLAGYAPGISGMESINPANCLNDELRESNLLSNPLECARTCVAGESKTCYYKFVVERYPVNGQACNLCMPNVTNTLCPNCQCVPGDGTQRMALTVNRMLPGPTIQVCEGDYVVVDVVNMLKSDSVTIHWHGVFQQGSPHYDGVPHLTQCPILMENMFRYQFYANNRGTHLWHAHTGIQKMDGIFGSFIVREPVEQDPSSNLYDFDLANHVIIINDWLREESISRFPGRRAGAIRQIPETFLINGKGRYIDPIGATTNIPFEVITVDARKRYRFRFINSFCTNCPTRLTIEGHNLTVIASDGQPLEPIVVHSIVSLAGERYDFVINTDQRPGAYWIQIHGLNECASEHIQQLAILQYEGASSTPHTREPTFDVPLRAETELNVADNYCYIPRSDRICLSGLTHALPVDLAILKKEPDVKLEISIGMHRYREEEVFEPNTYKNFLVSSPNWVVTQMMSNISSVSPPCPPLSQLEDVPKDQICNADNLPPNCSPTSVCSCIHVIKIPLNAIVEINLIDEFHTEGVQHPFHLHGFAFHVLGMGQPLGPTRIGNGKMTVDYFRELDNNNEIKRNFKFPPAKDTIAVPNNGYAIFRFRANNPGYWLFHCHDIFHVLAGMELTFQVGEPSDMPKTPKNFPRCGNYKPNIEITN